ncbi:MAG TPA: 3-hydroxyacyl-CoA dehydrogenase NAD-binding domain-containing protein, partial [Burkholderiales bacterium]
MTRIAALGAGRMGRGIGHVFAYAGYRVDVIDFKARAPEDGARLRAAALA